MLASRPGGMVSARRRRPTRRPQAPV